VDKKGPNGNVAALEDLDRVNCMRVNIRTTDAMKNTLPINVLNPTIFFRDMFSPTRGTALFLK